MHTATPFMLHHEKPRMGPAAMVSLTTHVLVLGTLMMLRYAPTHAPAVDRLSDTLSQGIVWLSERGPGGGGGGGGDQTKESPRAAALAGRDAITVPAQKPASIEPSSTPTDIDAVRQPD